MILYILYIWPDRFSLFKISKNGLQITDVDKLFIAFREMNDIHSSFLQARTDMPKTSLDSSDQ